MTTRIAVTGAAGRMGRALIAAIAQHPSAVLSGALERDGSAMLGRDAGLLAGLEACGVPVTMDARLAFAGADAVLDFTVPAASCAFAALAAEVGIAHVLGTTGLSDEDQAIISRAAERTAVVQSGNFSAGVILLSVLAERAAAALGSADWDIEIVEMHHRHKVDAPSGTALLLGEAAAAGRGVTLGDHAERGRDGHSGPRAQGAIGFASLRGGSVVGDHSVILAGPGERVVLSHHAEDRSIFARGAVAAACWAHGKAPGLYSMRDVLGIA